MGYCKAHRQVQFGDEGILDQAGLGKVDRRRLRLPCRLCGDCSRDIAVFSTCSSDTENVDRCSGKQYNLSKEIWW